MSIASVMTMAIDNVKTGAVTLDSRAGLASGGQSSDVSMRKAPLPCAWVLYAGDSSTESDPRGIPGASSVNHEIIVKVLVAYNNETTLKNISYPALEDVINAMITPVDTKTCEAFKYIGQSLEEIDNRLVYIQRYSITGSF
jgi:hypothetical protein